MAMRRPSVAGGGTRPEADASQSLGATGEAAVEEGKVEADPPPAPQPWAPRAQTSRAPRGKWPLPGVGWTEPILRLFKRRQS
eukprot:11028910-Alexandrium_andersonii.AAC.1